MVMRRIQKPCTNCGGTSYEAPLSPPRSAALMTCSRPDGGPSRIVFFPNLGTPVDLYVCNGCGEIRLFAAQEN